jgi:hypothetical protein
MALPLPGLCSLQGEVSEISGKGIKTAHHISRWFMPGALFPKLAWKKVAYCGPSSFSVFSKREVKDEPLFLLLTFSGEKSNVNSRLYLVRDVVEFALSQICKGKRGLRTQGERK